ncbi:MAG: hypothetical protein AB8B96_06505 [Lysobacterales bacterium]
MTNARSNKITVNWPQAFSEVSLLLAGVLLALAAQAWWEARAERETSLEHINNLIIELDANASGLTDSLAKHEGYIEVSVAILRGAKGPLSDAARETLLQRISRFSYISDYRPATAALDNLVGAGGLGQFDNASLQLAVSSYSQAIQNHNVLQSELTDFFFHELVPYLSEHIPLLSIHFVSGIPEPVPTSRFDLDLTALTESMPFENLVLRRISAEFDAKTTANRLLTATQELRQRLEQAR